MEMTVHFEINIMGARNNYNINMAKQQSLWLSTTRMEAKIYISV